MKKTWCLGDGQRIKYKDLSKKDDQVMIKGTDNQVMNTAKNDNQVMIKQGCDHRVNNKLLAVFQLPEVLNQGIRRL